MSSTNTITSSTSTKSVSVWTIGLAMFTMFFGAGNIIFPLAVGQLAQDKNSWAVIGLGLTAVLIPLAGLLAMMLFEGNYREFFKRIGKVPGFIMVALILAIIGPLGALPRCITISHSTMAQFGLDNIWGMNLITFSLISCAVVFLFTFRPNKILSLLGYVMTPVLILSLCIIIVKGIFSMSSSGTTTLTGWESFSAGLMGGYNTMDLLATFFFSGVVLTCLRKENDQTPLRDNKRLFMTAVLSCVIAAAALMLFYVGFSYLAAGYSTELVGVASHEILGKLALNLLGPYAGLVVGVAIFFACVTTEIALAAVFAQFLQKTLLKERVSYTTALIITLFIAFFVSTLRFEGISAFLVPILQICYPALIVLTVLNILHKLYNFKPVKILFYGTFLVSSVLYFVL